MKKTTIALIFITLISGITGFGRDIALSYYYGTSGVSDSYIIGTTIPLVLISVLAAAIRIIYIPMYNTIIEEASISKARLYTNNSMNIILLICTLIIIIVFIFTEPLVRIFASGFDNNTFKLAVNFTRITIIGIYFSALVAILSSFLQANNSILFPALAGVPVNLIIIVSIILSANYNIYILAVGSVISVIFQFLCVIVLAHYRGYRYKFIIKRNDKYLKKSMFLLFPIMIGVFIEQINIIVDRTLASQIVEGGISALTYANRINLFIQSLAVMSIITVVFPIISKLVAQGKFKELKENIAGAINGINLLLLPATIGVIVLAEPIVTLLFGRGEFDSHAIKLTSSALIFYSIGMVSVGHRTLLARVFYSLQDTKTPMINGAIALIINIILNFVLSHFLGIAGLALATSLSAIICTILFMYSLRKKINKLYTSEIYITTFKIIIASLFMGLLIFLFNNKLGYQLNEYVMLLLSFVIGLMVYIILISYLKIKEVDIIIDNLKNKINKVINKSYQ